MTKPKTCQRESCQEPIPEGFRKYCSRRCSKLVNGKNAALRSRSQARQRRTEQLAVGQYRECMRCGKRFKSKGRWNRFCDHCHDTEERVAPNRWKYIGEGLTVVTSPLEDEHE